MSGVLAHDKGPEAIGDLVEFLVRSLVDNLDAVSVESKETDEAVVVTIHVDPEDIGKVIGRHGSTVRAVRTLARAKGQLGGRRVEVEVAE